MTAVAALLFLFIFIGLLLGVDYGYVALVGYCEDTPVFDCLSGKKPQQPVKEAMQGQPSVIAAHGNLSVGKYSVNVTMLIPVEGGAVTGTFSGTCDGKITGAADKDGAISGKAFGSCSVGIIPVPARGTFDGTVIAATKSVPISGTGSALGVTKSGTITLTY